MANKFKPGIPDGFSLNVAPVADLGDYLDEPAPTPPARPRPHERTREAMPVSLPVPDPSPESTPTVKVQSVNIAANADASPTGRTVADVPIPKRAATPLLLRAEELTRAPRHTGPRREINMSPETLRMTEELLDLIRGGSGQRDTKANELIHALVLLAYEVRDEIDPHTLPKRGRWGSPTARAYPLEIKNAVRRAIERSFPTQGPHGDA